MQVFGLQPVGPVCVNTSGKEFARVDVLMIVAFTAAVVAAVNVV